MVVDPAVRAYFRRIGAKGGRAGAGTPLRQEIAKRAAQKRWAKHRKANHPEYNIEWLGGSLRISPVLPQPLLDELKYYERKGAKDHFAGHWVNLYTVESKTTIQTHAGFLDRIERYLDKAGATFAVTQEGPPPLEPNYNRLLRLHQDDQRVVKQLLRSKAGGAAVMNMERIEPIICALVDAFGARETVVVVRDVKLAEKTYQVLSSTISSHGTVGILAGRQADNGDVAVITAAALSGSVVDPAEVKVLIFVDPPKKGRQWLTETILFGAAKKIALLCPENYPAPQRRILEAVFGPVSISNKCVAAMHRQTAIAA